MQDEEKIKCTPRFGQPSQTDFSVLLKESVKKSNKNAKLQKKEKCSKFNISKNEQKQNLNEKHSSEKLTHINKELAIQRWFCDYPNKRFTLRNDYDYENSKKFLLEKEIAFEKLDFCDDLLLKNQPNNSN